MSRLVDTVIGCAALGLVLGGQSCSCSSPATPPGDGGAGGSVSCEEEICDGTDNDCDGVVDENCPCVPGQTQRCFAADPAMADVGVCRSGRQQCETGLWGSPCEGELGSEDEVCNGLDDDCDGSIDEGCSCDAGTTQDCYPSIPITMGIGRCATGLQTCQGDAWGPCVGAVTPIDELCNGADDDCDGIEDNGCECPPNAGGPALVAAGTPDGGHICIDATEVTRGQYQAWLDSSPTLDDLPPECSWKADFTPPIAWPPLATEVDLPVVAVDWCDAHAYCAAQDKHLCGAIVGGSVPVDQFANPSQSEWFSACSDRGLAAYPYGSSYDPMACNGFDLGTAEVVAVGSLPQCRGLLEVFDLSGNVWEWESSCDGVAGLGDECRIRGGGFNNVSTDLACAADATAPRDMRIINVGFRCCAEPLPDPF